MILKRRWNIHLLFAFYALLSGIFMALTASLGMLLGSAAPGRTRLAFATLLMISLITPLWVLTWSAVAALAAFPTGLGMLLRSTAPGRAGWRLTALTGVWMLAWAAAMAALPAFTAGFTSLVRIILMRGSFFMGRFSTFAGNFALLIFIHGSKAAIASWTAMFLVLAGVVIWRHFSLLKCKKIMTPPRAPIPGNGFLSTFLQKVSEY
jgi:hypothetical protein